MGFEYEPGLSCRIGDQFEIGLDDLGPIGSIQGHGIGNNDVG